MFPYFSHYCDCYSNFDVYYYQHCSSRTGSKHVEALNEITVTVPLPSSSRHNLAIMALGRHSAIYGALFASTFSRVGVLEI